jgi:ABC-type branched-subunit amino acid transport system ATPase component
MKGILNIQDLYKHFEGIVAVDHVNLSVLPGTITGIYGDNGAGKTTLFNLISGIEKPESGKILFFENDITRASVIKRARMGLGRLFQTPRVFNDITIYDNLLAAGNNHTGHYLHNYFLKPHIIKRNKIKDSEKAQKILKQFNLIEKAGLKAFKLSEGERKLLSLGCLMMNDVKILLLDEPFSSINEKMIVSLKSILMELKASRHTLLIIEHDLDRLDEIVDICFEMRQGKLNKKTYYNNANC